MLELVFTEGPRGLGWPLRRAPDRGRSGVLGWVRQRWPIDGGAPSRVVDIVTAALCARWAVTFAQPLPAGVKADEGWVAVPGGQACELPPRRYGWRVGRVLGKNFPLRWTTDAVAARALFEAAPFNWTEGNQAVLVSRDRNRPPPLTGGQVREVFWTLGPHDDPDLVRVAGVEALLFPGVDGDFMEIIGLTGATWSELLTELQAQARGRGVGWRVVDEETFRNQRWAIEERTRR